MELQVFIGSTVASIAAHLALAASFFLAEARPFDNVPQQLITVDIVLSKEIVSLQRRIFRNRRKPSRLIGWIA